MSERRLPPVTQGGMAVRADRRRRDLPLRASAQPRPHHAGRHSAGRVGTAARGQPDRPGAGSRISVEATLRGRPLGASCLPGGRWDDRVHLRPRPSEQRAAGRIDALARRVRRSRAAPDRLHGRALLRTRAADERLSMADTGKIAKTLERFAQAVASHDRENPTHNPYGIGLAHFDMERLGFEEGEGGAARNITIEADGGSPATSACSATPSTTRARSSQSARPSRRSPPSRSPSSHPARALSPSNSRPSGAARGGAPPAARPETSQLLSAGPGRRRPMTDDGPTRARACARARANGFCAPARPFRKPPPRPPKKGRGWVSPQPRIAGAGMPARSAIMMVSLAIVGH